MKRINIKEIKKYGSALYWLMVLFFLFIAAGTALSVFKTPGGYRMFVVMSGSMEPSIKTGSVVLVKEQSDYEENEIITFLRNPGDDIKEVKSTVTHRLVEVKEEDGNIRYTTKGDANNTPDLEDVTKEQVLGKVLISVPWVGRAIAFTKTQLGFTLLIVVPAVLLIYNEAMNIKKEIAEILSKRKSKKDKSETKKDGEKDNK